MAAERDPDLEKEPEEVKRGRAFAELRDHSYVETSYDPAAAAERLKVLGVGYLVKRREQETEPEMLERNLFGESRIDEDARLGRWD